MLLQPRQLAPLVPYNFPPTSFLKLLDYITNLVNTYGGVYWPLDDAVNNPYCRVINTAVATGRELVIAGDMSDATKWVVGTNWAVSGGVATASSVTTAQLLSQVILQVGRAYTVTYTVVVTSGTVSFNLGSTAVSTGRSASGTYTETLVCSGNSTFSFRATSGTFSGTIDNVSVKELNIPAYNATPSQLLNTDVWNGLGVGAWTTSNATITAVSTTRHDGNTGTVVHLVRNAGPATATQTVMTIGLVYRVYGWARGNGTNNPRVAMGGGTTALFTGAVSTDWQPFDLIFVATATTLDLVSLGSVANYVEFDVTVVALDTGIRTDANLVLNGNFAAGTNWTLGAGWTISGGVLVATAAGAGIATVQTGGVVIGKRYLVTYDVVVTSGSVRIALNTALGTTRTVSGTYSEVLICTGASDVRLSPVSTFTGTIDNVIVTELSPLVGLPVNGVVLGNAESNRLLVSVSFDGVNDLINLYSAQLNSVFPINEGTLVFFFKTSSWSAGTKIAVRLSDGVTNNLVQIYQSAANQLTFIYEAGGTTKSVVKSSVSSLAWHCLSLTWSKAADQVIAYFDNVQEGSTQTGLGSWNANFSSSQMVLAGFSTGSSNAWGGNQAHLTILNTPLAIDYVSEISKLGDTF